MAVKPRIKKMYACDLFSNNSQAQREINALLERGEWTLQSIELGLFGKTYYLRNYRRTKVRKNIFKYMHYDLILCAFERLKTRRLNKLIHKLSL